MNSPGYRLGSILGVEVRLDWSLIVIFGLITANLGAGVFPAWHPEWSTAVTWVTAVAAAVLFFVSVLLHELAHALAGRIMKTPIHRITLFLFGGVGSMSAEPESAGAELFIAIVGPLTSFTLGVLATVAGTLLLGPEVLGLRSGLELDLLMRTAGPLATLLVWLGPVNIGLALFNLIPGFPLDGGRVLRSLFWALTRDFARATQWAAVSGQIFAGLLMAGGVVFALSGQLGQGLWFMLIGWFLGSAARSTWSHVQAKVALGDVPVSRVMRTAFERVPPGMGVDDFVRDCLMKTDQHAWPVESDGRLYGLVVWEDVRRVPQPQWRTTAVSAVMTPRERLVTLTVEQSAEEALELMSRCDVDQLPVVDGAHLVGMVRRRDLLRWIALQPTEHYARMRPLHH